MMRKETVQITVDVFIGGDFNTALNLCSKFCERGLCVSVQATTFVYTYGVEQGVKVTLTNYARFPSDETRIFSLAEELAECLMLGLSQGSYSIIGAGRSVFVSRRSQDTGAAV